jgi:hypothetical protein
VNWRRDTVRARLVAASGGHPGRIKTGHRIENQANGLGNRRAPGGRLRTPNPVQKMRPPTEAAYFVFCSALKSSTSLSN